MSRLNPGDDQPGRFPSHQSIPARGRRRSVMLNQATETMKEKQARAKETRERRRLSITAQHKHIFDMVAQYLQLEPGAVEEFVIDTKEQIDLMNAFIDKDGPRTLKFYYQEGPCPGIEECGRTFSGVSKGSPVQLLFATDCKKEPLTGTCVYFIKNKAETLTTRNIAEEMQGGVFTVKDKAVLPALKDLLTKVYCPAMAGLGDWGALSRATDGGATRQTFLDNLDRFIHTMEGANQSICGAVRLKASQEVDLSNISSADDCMTAAGNPETVSVLEGLVSGWGKQIEQVLAESDQMRKEADDTGPLAELEHWRQLTARFNSILEQIKGHECKMAIHILNSAKSKVLKEWRRLDSRITDAANEAKDNVKYMYSLQKFCAPLYACDPVSMAEGIASLIHAIRMIHGISRYYNTSERMTSLFIKVTNQMVTACKKYITDKGMCKIWEQDYDSLMEKMKECINLYTEYQKAFQRTKKQIEETPGEKPFEFSEMYIFGKFDAFCKRLENIMGMMSTLQSLSSLVTSKIEGLEPMANRYLIIYNNMKKKPYDILDHRKMDFSTDYKEFKRQIGDLEEQLQDFLDDSFERSPTCHQALKLLVRVKKLGIPSLNVGEKCKIIFLQFGQEVENIRKMYMQHRDDPPVPRDMPPVAGKIAWARQLTRRITEPMEIFKETPEVFKIEEGKRIIRNYNRVARVLMEFEMLYHDAWIQSVAVAKEGLRVPVLVRHPETKTLLVNFDPLIYQVIRESNCIIKLGLEVPEEAKMLCHTQDQLKKYQEKMQLLLEENEKIRGQIPSIFLPLMDAVLKKVDNAIRPGLTILTWTSLNLDQYFDHIQTSLRELRLLIKQISDIKDTHIDTPLLDISETMLCDLPEKEPWTIQEFLDKTKKHCEECVVGIEAKSEKIEDAVIELSKIFLTRAGYDLEPKASKESTSEQGFAKITVVDTSEDAASEEANSEQEEMSEEEMSLREQCVELKSYFNHRLLDALLRATRLSLDLIRKRVFFHNSHLGKRKGIEEETRDGTFDIAFFKADLILEIPNVVMKASLDDIQQAINKASHYVLEVSKGVIQWGQQRYQLASVTDLDPHHHHTPYGKRMMQGEEDKKYEMVPIPENRLKNYFKNISDHKDVSKVVMMLSSACNSFRDVIGEALQQYKMYYYLWEKDREQTVTEFLQTEPTLSEFRAEIQQFERLQEEIDEMELTQIVGPIALSAGPLKLALSVERKSWEMMYARQLNIKYKEKMEEIGEFVEQYMLRLSRPIKDLEDVRHSMEGLEDIRQNQIRIDMTLGPIEEAYAMLAKYNISVTNEETNKVDTLRYSFMKLIRKAGEIQDELVKIQPNFKSELLHAVEVFHHDLDDFRNEYDSMGPMAEGIPPQEASERLTIYQNRFDDLWRKFNTYSAGEQLFGLPVTDYPDLAKTKKELTLLQKLYGLYNAVMASINGYFDIIWTEVDIEKINAELMDFQNRCRKLPKALKDWQAFLDLKKKIDDFSESCPLLEMMANKAMKDRHWDRIANLTGHTFDLENENFALRNIMEAPLLESKEDIEDVCISAVKEKDIEAKLKQVVADWSNQVLSFAPFKNRGELLLKGGEIQEIVALMEDSLMVLSSLLSNRYNAPFKKDIQEWVSKLSNTTDIIENWMVVQNLWVYLEAVFVGGDIAKQLPTEAKRFQNIDKSWVKIMTRAHETTNVVQCCVGDETLGQLLPHLLEQLELCQKSLTGYLEGKRLLFPRFFFVSDPALLEILGQASDSHTIQAHLLGVFENVNEVEFHEKDYDRILACVSREGEKIMLETEVMAKGNVETWLMELLIQQQKSLHAIIREADRVINDSGFDMLKFLNDYIAQVGLLGIQMLWTRDAEEALTNARHDKTIMGITNQKFLDILNKLIEQTTHELTKVERVKFETLVTIHVHQRDIFDDLTRMHIRNPADFEWLKQARFYFKEDTDQCIVSVTDVDFIYQNESLGCTDRLVITPLTDRCYITLAQALGMSMGGAPAGPAGTGKTETTKDMGKALGKYVVVFNCSDQMDFRGLGRIYKGLAQSGSWGCFDEFNRIDLPVLSVAAQQIHIILSARKERKKQFIFSDGDTVDLNPEFGFFITMNPGYAGRQELPENLKIQFRSVAMMVPDRQIIMRVKLASCGFIENVILAQKFYTLYKLCEEQLSKQVHYDFGLRNILSVLRTLGAQKRARPTETESTIVMRVLRDMNLSKLVDEDEPLFLSLIGDLFPGIQLDNATYEELQVAIEKEVSDVKLVNHPSWNLKLVQLYETQNVRHGMMTLGPSGAGKSCCIHVLMKAMTDCGAPHREMRMNPKAITAPQMFGRLDVATNDWTDGIFSTLWRRSLKAKKGEHIWIVLDGPVDAIWIENLNSVLDDNKTLTLANGDRIPMSPTCKIIFEVHNIDNASPATVSRNGMVYMSSSALDWRPILQGWLNNRIPAEADILQGLFDKIFDDIYNYASVSLESKMEVLQCNQIRQTCDLLEGLIIHAIDHDKAHYSANHLERIFIFALMWSIGALLELEDRAKMEEFLKSHESHLDLPPVKGEETIFEYVVSASGEWEHWLLRVEEYVYSSEFVPEFSSILVPNVDNVRTSFLIETISKQSKAVLLIGEQGTAKTVMIQGYMATYDPDQHLSKSFNFSSASTPMMFQRTIESYVDKRMGSTYGPPGGRKMTVFVDDVNMPIINEWGDQVTNEITRQMMEMHGMYSLEKPGDFTHIVDVQFIAAMIQPGGGRNDIPQRLKRQFSIFNCTLPSNNSIDKIFGIIGEGYFCSTRFCPEVVELIKQLVPATRILWQQTKVKMLPTPAKFHYIFNLRDLSRIWQGMLTIKGDECASSSVLMALWKNECYRVIADRFTNEDDKKWFEEAVIRVAKEHVGEEYAEMVKETHYFVDFLRDAPEPTGEEPEDAEIETPKLYEPIPSFEELKERLQFFVANYNETIRGAHMDLVFFQDAMVHLIVISRIIRTPRGNALLVGVGGSGKQSLTRLASFIAGYKIYQITLTRTYNVSNLMDDLKYLYNVAGAEGNGITFIFTDNEIKDEAFLEYMNNVLSSGEVSNLFARDEMDEITQELIPVMKKEHPRRPPTQENLYDYFISRARNNLHVVLCFSPVGEKFRNRSLKFPGLISGCTMDWFSRWPRDALIAVSNHFLSNYKIVTTDDTKQHLVEAMGFVHDNVANTCVEYFQRYRRQTHVTPKSYLSFIDGYKSIYSEKYDHIGELANRMATGLNKLIEATQSVDQLSKDLKEKEKELAVANVKADKVLAEVTVSAQEAEKVKASVQKVKDKAQKIVDEINHEKAIAHAKLEDARPALEEAESALQTIKPAHISTVRKLGKPPHLIMRIMDCVLILFQKSVDPVTQDPERPCVKPSWGESLKLMSGGGFLQSLQTFPKDSINAETVELLQPYLEMEDYNFDTAKKVCGDVAGLCSWTKAMSFFYGINKEVLPLKANLAVQEAKLTVATKELNSAQAQLDEKQKELDAVQAIYDAAMKEKQELLDDAETCRRKMDAASALINGLAGEKVRWTAQSKEFKSQIDRLVGDVLLCTGFLSYAGPFNQEFRTTLRNNWQSEMMKRRIPFTTDLNITDMLVDNATIGEWNLQGLPNDDLSIQNGIIVTKATRYPLLIDPQGQGKNWIKNREKDRELQLTSLNHKYFRTHMEDALSLGRPLLIEDVSEELDPALDNVLEKNFIKSGRTYKVKVGDKEVDVMDGFYLYITTKLPNPAYTPEISARTSIIDFTVTMKGLEDQLLGRVILTEKQELEAERTKLMEDVTSNKRKMQELEDNLLYKLTSTKGSLVDDESLISVLAVTKQTAAEVSEKLAVAAETEIKINDAREEFRPVATEGSILYFLICEMSMVNTMYQTSLKQFLGLFDHSMARSDKSPVTSKRINNIIDYLRFEVFAYSCRGLYENHKFLFTLLLCLKIDTQKGNVSHQEFQILIKGGAALDLNAVQPKPCKWILDMTWLNLVELSKLGQFRDILHQIPGNEKSWKTWFDSDAPEETVIPDGYSSALDTFRKLLLIRSWCPDRTMAQARKYIADSMGKRYADPVILNLEATWGESDPRTPLICLLSMGSDPTNQIEGLAKKLHTECRAISMGQGQEVHARKLVALFMQSGGWALLQNCHLGLEFMDELLETLTDTETIHEGFRVWITTEVHDKFPISLLQASIKFTNEPPQGIKAGLMRTYVAFSQDFLDISSMPQWKPMLYTVSFLHTVVQERRKFGPLGWNIPYEFNSADLTASVQFIQNHLDDMDVKKGPSWNTVRYMLGEVQYGGRVTDDYDKRLLNTFAKVWFCDAMFSDSFQFYIGYKIPKCKTVEQHLAFIEELPTVDSPEAFGLHPNADITYQGNTAKEVLDTIVNIQPKEGGGGGGETRESVVFKLADDMLSKLPQDYLPHEVRDRLKKMGILQPLNIFLKQEIDRMQKVITVVRTTLSDLKLAIEGTIIMSENLRDALDNMYDARVPALWRKISWQSTTLGFWFTEMLERNDQFFTWIFEGRPKYFWMTGFFNPQGFLTAMRQEVTRAHKGWALDSVTLHNDVTKYLKEDVTSAPSEGVYIYGLYLDGAAWDRKNCRLVDSQPKVLFVQMPVVHMYAINSTAPKDPKLYQCPVYKKPHRTDLTYITFIVLRTAVSPDHWTLRGVAALCDIK
ncbi:dynein heavy chain 8, axonemal [Lingula anatina]|uniref:Dynein heavy chain 8, axonemal n=2 Tax=Lingula anatina TaxID=7574 RepID=A0A2R2MRH6_LINAN|nr:dynein heavy chain 8, axonemal [Lingula anatina]|eukprot:XP_023932850.1 dynein heavy chain 8, axonemal [Lingula anatina]